MRENHKMMALTAILAAGVVLAGCGATNSAEAVLWLMQQVQRRRKWKKQKYSRCRGFH